MEYVCRVVVFFFFKQKTAYEIRKGDWSSDVCSSDLAFARRMVDTPKVVFSKTLTRVEGKNVRVETGDLVQAIKQLKAQRGKDIVVYGGATFVSALIEHDLIDEFNIFVNPVAIGRGMRIFNDRKTLRSTGSTAYPSGVVNNTYQPVR